MSGFEQSATMTEREALARRFFEEAFNEGRLEVLDSVVSDDYRSHDPQDPLPDLRGPAAARALVQHYRAAFPDVRFTIDEDASHLGESIQIPPHWEHRRPEISQLEEIATVESIDAP